jgi:hypothetical protein
MVSDEHETAAPLEIATELKLRFAPDVPQDMSMVPAVARVEATSVAHVAVLVAFAEESCVIAFAALLPELAAAKAVALRTRSARSTCAPRAVSASVGWVPS